MLSARFTQEFHAVLQIQLVITDQDRNIRSREVCVGIFHFVASNHFVAPLLQINLAGFQARLMSTEQKEPGRNFSRFASGRLHSTVAT